MARRVWEIALWVLLGFIALVEYCVLIWYWTSGGKFNLLTVPIVFIALLVVHLLLMRTCQRSNIACKVLLSSLLVANPVLIVVLVEMIARMIGIAVSLH